MKYSEVISLYLDQLPPQLQEQFLRGAYLAFDAIMSEINSYDSNILATMNCWELIEDLQGRIATLKLNYFKSKNEG